MRALALFAIGLVFGGGVGFLVAASQGITMDGHDHQNPAQHGAAMDHAGHDMPLEIDAADAPEMAIGVTHDPVSGYNLHLKIDQFEFAPEQAGLAHVAGQGHAHVYVNGVKIARLYGPWLHIAALPAGAAEVEVTLNANDHRTLTVGGKPISATAIVPVK